MEIILAFDTKAQKGVLYRLSHERRVSFLIARFQVCLPEQHPYLKELLDSVSEDHTLFSFEPFGPAAINTSDEEGARRSDHPQEQHNFIPATTAEEACREFLRRNGIHAQYLRVLPDEV